MNKLIKDCQERKKLDCVKFAEEFEDFISQQESDILRTFLGVSSPYIIRKEYLDLAIKFNKDFSNKTVEEKERKHLNVIVDEKCYRSILNYVPGKQAIERARNNVVLKFSQSISVEPFHVGISNDSASNEQIDTQFQNETENDASCKDIEIKGNTSYDPATMELLYSDAGPYKSKSIESGSIQKAMTILDKKEVSKSFEEESYFVKSYTQRLPHLVSTKFTGNIFCEEACKRPINVGFCSHAIAVALHTESLEKYISYLNRTIETTTSLHQRRLIKERLEEKSLFRGGCGLCPHQIAKKKKKTIQHISTYTNFIKHLTSSNKHRSSCHMKLLCYLEQLTSFRQTTFPAATGSINLHPTINQINTTIFEHDLKEIKTDQIVLTLVQLCHPKVSKCCGCGTFLNPNNVISETPNDLVFVSNTLIEYEEEGQTKFSLYPQNIYIKVHDQDPYTCLRKKLNFHVEAIKLHDQALLELNATHVAKILCDCKLVHLAPYLT